MRKTAVLLVVVMICISSLLVFGGAFSKTPSLKVKGSTTMLPLMDLYAEEYEGYNNIRVDVFGGGSGVGINSVANGRADIGMSSRDLTRSEINSGLVVTEIGTDAVAIIVHSDLASIGSLTKTQLISIFSGEISNWSELGGPDKTIALIIREDGSGTRECFEKFSGSVPKDVRHKVVASTGEMIASVNMTPGAIGYVSLGSDISSCTTLAFDNEDGNGAVEPNVDNVRSGTYAMTRPLILVTKGIPTGNALEFIEWILGEKGQEILEAMGFIPTTVTPEWSDGW